MADQDRTGLLIIRVERQDAYLLITLTMERSPAGRPIGDPPQRQVRFADRDAALAEVRAFLASF